jgi:hypothetical protein
MLARVRRLGLAVLLALVVVPGAAAKTIKLDWRERKVLADGSAVRFHVTEAVVTARSWAVTFSITNGSGAALKLVTPAPGTTPIRGFAVLRRGQWRGETCLLDFGSRGWNAYDPPPSQLPRSIGAGATWTGTISGKAKLARGRDYRLSFGWFEPLDPDTGGRGFYWITDHSFRL